MRVNSFRQAAAPRSVRHSTSGAAQVCAAQVLVRNIGLVTDTKGNVGLVAVHFCITKTNRVCMYMITDNIPDVTNIPGVVG